MFTYSVQPSEGPAHEALYFAFSGQLLLVERKAEHLGLPTLALSHGAIDVALSGGHPARIDGGPGAAVRRSIYLGELDGRPCYAIEVDGGPADSAASSGTAAGEGQLALLGIRSLMGEVDDETFRAAGIASQILDWDRDHAYCGRCGTPTVAGTSDRSRACPNCGLSAYPRISPAIIVAVVRDDRILLARNKRHRASGVFSVIAGFVEPGESLEQCVHREIREEVDIEVRSLRYFASQPWPFPNSLMVAFVAEYAGGVVRPDGVEIIEADWFGRTNLPKVPPHGTVARTLIDWYLEGSDRRA